MRLRAESPVAGSPNIQSSGAESSGAGTRGADPPTATQDSADLLRRRRILVGAWLGGLSACAAVLTPRRPSLAAPALPLGVLAPPQVGPWRTIEIADDIVPETLEESEAADRTILESYGAEALPAVMLATSYHSGSSVDIKVHRPEVCYQSAGFILSQVRNRTLLVAPGVALPARVFTAARGSRVEQVLYWSRLAQDFPRDNVEQRLAMMRYGLRGVAADGLLMRFSMFGEDAPAATAVLERFAQILFASVPAGARRMMAGARAG